jgi:hypothetical protein
MHHQELNEFAWLVCGGSGEKSGKENLKMKINKSHFNRKISSHFPCKVHYVTQENIKKRN